MCPSCAGSGDEAEREEGVAKKQRSVFQSRPTTRPSGVRVAFCCAWIIPPLPFYLVCIVFKIVFNVGTTPPSCLTKMRAAAPRGAASRPHSRRADPRPLHPPGPPPRATQCASTSARGGDALAVDPTPAQATAPTTALPTPTLALAAAALLAVGAAVGRAQRGGGRSGDAGLPLPPSSPPPRDFAAAVAATRRSVALSRALQAASFGAPTAAAVELDAALAAHAASGGGWEEGTELPAGTDAAAVDRLYTLALRNADLPLRPGATAPLRSLLRLSAGHADALEAATLGNAGDFSI